LTGFELDRVETLLRERSAEMTRTRDAARLHPSLDDVVLDQADSLPASSSPEVEVTLEGTCTNCGDRISAARLKAIPDAVRCVSCQRAFEAGLS
jgi:RNA polymerase-binding transcription factor DksA